MDALLSPSATADPLLSLADRLDPPKIDVFAALGYEPTPRQQVFHDATEFDVLYGGAAGGGKTRALLMHAIRACVWYPGMAVAAFRRSYPELEESLLAELERAMDAVRDLGGRYNASKHDLVFANGSRVRFRHARTVDDATKRQGSEIQLLVVDERTQVPPAVVSYLATRLRSGNRHIPVLGIRSGTNPGGIGHADVKTTFVDGTDHGRKVVADPDRPYRLRRFIPAKVDDNPHVNAEYEDDLNAIADPELRKALKDGDWDIYPGQFFRQWRRDRHVVPAFTIPPSWKRGAGIDWGMSKPHAVVWAAVDGDRRVWVYAEDYGCVPNQPDTGIGLGERALARRLLEREARHSGRPAWRVADPSMWAKVGDAHPIAETFIAERCHIQKADNDRITGAARVHTYLNDGPACGHHRQLGWATCPLLHVLDDAAPHLERTLPALPRDKDRPEDVDTDAEDHAYDALRYLLMQLPVPRTSTPKPGAGLAGIDARIAKKKAERGIRRRPNHPTVGRL